MQFRQDTGNSFRKAKRGRTSHYWLPIFQVRDIIAANIKKCKYFVSIRGSSWPVGWPGILWGGVFGGWETVPGASGGRVPSTFLPLLDLPAVVNNPFFVLPAYFLRNIAKTLSMSYGGGEAVGKTPYFYPGDRGYDVSPPYIAFSVF